MRYLIFFYWVGCILLGLYVGSSAAAAELTNAEFSASRVYNYRNLYAPEYTLLGESGAGKDEYWSHQIDLDLDMKLWDSKDYHVYWDQNVQAQSTNKQYRRVHWDFELGLNTFNKVDIFWHHRSEHFLDVERDSYPLKDVYGLRFCLLQKGCK